MTEPLITVVMPTFNAGPALRQAVASVLAQTLTDFELVIIDDCSTDGSTDFLGSNNDERIRCFRNELNLGAANSRNRAIGLARGKFIAIADADDLLLPHRLALQATMMKEHPEISVVSGAHRTFTGSEEPSRRCASPLTTNAGVSLALRWGPSFAHGTVLVRKEALLDSGGYRQRFEPTEDYDLYARLLKAGHRFGAVPDVVLLYRMSPEGLSATQSERSREVHHEVSARVRQQVQLPRPAELIRAARVEPRLSRGNPRVRYAKLLVRSARAALTEKDLRSALGAAVAFAAVGPTTWAHLASEASTRAFSNATTTRRTRARDRAWQQKQRLE